MPIRFVWPVAQLRCFLVMFFFLVCVICKVSTITILQFVFQFLAMCAFTMGHASIEYIHMHVYIVCTGFDIKSFS